MLEARQICKSFATPVLNEVDLKILQGEFITLLGPSGCGKTTFLRIIAGLENPDSGELLLNGKDILSTKPQNRPFHMVFQRYALFPHMTVEENIGFSLRIKKLPQSDIKKRTDELLEIIQLGSLRSQNVQTLSGGQSQRVALARALADRPQVLLLDEPLSALDEKIRVSLRAELKSLQKKLGLTFVFVTHDQQEAFQLSDRIALFGNGKIEQLSTPEDLYSKPESEFAAEFVGFKNLIKKTESQSLYLQPEHLQWDHGSEIKLTGVIELKSLNGIFSEIHLKTPDGHEWRGIAAQSLAQKMQVGHNVSFSYSSEHIISVKRKTK